MFLLGFEAVRPDERKALDALLGELAPAERARLDLAEGRPRFRAQLNRQQLVEAWETGVELLKHAPDDAEFLVPLAWIAQYRHRDPATAIEYGERAVAKVGGDVRLRRTLADAYRAAAATPLAVRHLRAVLEKDPESKPVLAELKGLAPYGMDAYEELATAEWAGYTGTRYRVAGSARDVAQTQGRRHWIFRRDGAFAFALYDLEQPGGKTELVLGCPHGVDSVRTFDAAPAEEAVDAIVREIVAAAPEHLEALSLRRLSCLPAQSIVVARGLGKDPKNQKLLALQKDLKSWGWDRLESGEPVAAGELSRRRHRPTGTPEAAAPRVPLAWTWESKDGRLVRHVALYPAREPAKHAMLWAVRPDGNFLLRRFAEVPAEAEIEKLLDAGDASLEPWGRARAEQGRGERFDRNNACFDLAATLYGEALKKDPGSIGVHIDLVRCSLAATDREPDPAAAAPWYARGLASARKLAREGALDPESKVALAVFLHRFGAHPVAVELLNAAGDPPGLRGRAPELLQLLKTTGEDRWEELPAFEAGGFGFRSFRRSPAAGSPPPAEGLRVAEHCFVASVKGAYAFTMSYRVLRMKDAVVRDLAVSRFEQPAVLRSYAADPTLDELKAEIPKVLESLGVAK